MKLRFTWIFLISIISTGLFANNFASNNDLAQKTIAQIAASDTQFSTLVSALERTNLTATLNEKGSFTVFAPTNDAFKALGVDLNTVSDEDLTQILLYHVVGSEVKSNNIMKGQTYATTVATGQVEGKGLSILLEKTDSGVSINGKVNVISADVDASNGVIHVVDAVMMPLDVVGHALANKNFSELVGALSAAAGGLVSVLQGEGPFTVFAPVNDAFKQISEVTATLTADQLASVLIYHVVGGANFVSESLKDGQIVSTVNGGGFTVNIGNGVTLTDTQGNVSNVVLTDVQATNGVIHVLDKVILPNL